MKFEVINNQNQVIMHTEFSSCIPNKEILDLIVKAGYKIRLNGKVLSNRTLNKQLEEIKNG